MNTTPQAALLREAAQNALITLDGIASANPRDTADFETPAEWIAWAKSRARWAADALRAPVAQEIYAERILKQMLQAEKKCGTCGFIGQEDPIKGCPKCGFDDMQAKLQATQAVEVPNTFKLPGESEDAWIDRITGATQAEPVQAPGKWEGAEEWMPLAWELCADECGEEACTELVWEGGPIPEPWGDRWLKYEDEAKRLIALIRKHVPAVAVQPAQAGELPEEPDMESALAAMGITVWGPRAEAFKAGADWQAALSARKPLTCGDLNPDRIFGLADVHADESQEDGRRIFDRDGLVGFAMDAARIGAYPATAPLTKAQIKDLAQDEELLLICDGLDSLEDIVSVIERAHGIGTKEGGQ